MVGEISDHDLGQELNVSALEERMSLTACNEGGEMGRREKPPLTHLSSVRKTCK